MSNVFEISHQARKTWTPILVTTASYIVFVKAVPNFLKWLGVPPMRGAIFRDVWSFWNFLLAVQSAVVFVISLSFMIQLKDVHDDQIETLLCDPEFEHTTARNQLAVRLAHVSFVLSKIFELGDTVFLVVSQKKVDFLHWFHHASVLLFTWQSTLTFTPSSTLQITMNSFVHTVMYLQQAIVIQKLQSFPKWVPFTITTFQILQMIVGLFANVYILARTFFDKNESCNTPLDNAWWALAMYFAQALLFLKYFVERYICAKSSVAAQKRSE